VSQYKDDEEDGKRKKETAEYDEKETGKKKRKRVKESSESPVPTPKKVERAGASRIISDDDEVVQRGRRVISDEFVDEE
jgi:hypothetical protein